MLSVNDLRYSFQGAWALHAGQVIVLLYISAATFCPQTGQVQYKRLPFITSG